MVGRSAKEDCEPSSSGQSERPWIVGGAGIPAEARIVGARSINETGALTTWSALTPGPPMMSGMCRLAM